MEEEEEELEVICVILWDSKVGEEEDREKEREREEERELEEVQSAKGRYIAAIMNIC